MICHYRFLSHGFKFQDSVCNGCHGLTVLTFDIRNIAIITIKNVDYHCIIHNISRSKAINIKNILCLLIVGIYKTILS